MSENKMRILVISDSHGRNDDVAGVIEQVGQSICSFTVEM